MKRLSFVRSKLFKAVSSCVDIERNDYSPFYVFEFDANGRSPFVHPFSLRKRHDFAQMILTAESSSKASKRRS